MLLKDKEQSKIFSLTVPCGSRVKRSLCFELTITISFWLLNFDLDLTNDKHKATNPLGQLPCCLQFSYNKCVCKEFPILGKRITEYPVTDTP
jgi:hypothetical protein